MRLDAISTFTVDRCKKKRQTDGAAASTINRELASLSHFFSMATELKWLDRPYHPRMLKESPGRIIALGDKQCDALMRASIGSPDPYCWLFAAFGLNTAMRHQEILTEMLLRKREMRSDREGWIFPSPHKDSGTGHRARIDIAFRDVVTSAGLDPKQVTPHVMGHAALTKLVQAGVDLPTIQKIPGHKTVWCCATRTCNIDRAIRTIGQGLPEQQRTRQVARLHRNYKETLATA